MWRVPSVEETERKQNRDVHYLRTEEGGGDAKEWRGRSVGKAGQSGDANVQREHGVGRSGRRSNSRRARAGRSRAGV